MKKKKTWENAQKAKEKYIEEHKNKKLEEYEKWINSFPQLDPLANTKISKKFKKKR